MESLLSAGALTQILEGHKPAYPVLQIIGYKPMAPDQVAFGTATEDLRYRLMIGDGLRAHQYCVITNQDLVQDIQSGKLEKWSIVKVTSYQTVDTETQPDSKRLVYILNLEVIKKGSEVGRKLTLQQTGTELQQNHQQQPQPTLQAPQQQYYNNNTSNQPPPSYQNQPMQQQSINRQAGYNNEMSAQQTQPQPYPGVQRCSTRSPMPMRSSHENQFIGIADLTPYIGKFVIKGRCTAKSALREYNNAKGGGKLFNFTLADKTGEIKITAFNADCERTFPYVEMNKVYILGRVSVKPADKRYSQAEYELTLNNDSLLEEITDSTSASDVPQTSFSFASIATLNEVPPNKPVDLIGAILTVSDVSTILSKTKNKELKKRNLTIVDKSRHSISVTLWGEQADNFTGQPGDVFITKGARISSYGGRSASAGDCVFINPELPEARAMRNWYNNLLDQNFTCLTSSQDSLGPSGDQWKSLASMMDLEQAKNVVSSGSTSASYGKCKAMLMAVGKLPVYKACPVDGCNKKLVDTQNGELKCEKCQQTYTTYKYRYMTSVEIEDQSSSSWVTLWDEKAESLFQMKPEELERYMRMEDKEQYEKIITRPNFKTFTFTLRSRIDSYNGEEKVRLNVINMAPTEPVSYSKHLIEEIKSLG